MGWEITNPESKALAKVPVVKVSRKKRKSTIFCRNGKEEPSLESVAVEYMMRPCCCFAAVKIG